MSSSVSGKRVGHGTPSLRQGFIKITQVYIITYILINEILFSVFSCWKSSVGLCHSNEPCQRSRDLRVDDKGPSVSQSVTKSQSASTEFGRTTFIEKEKINNIGVVFLLENDKLHDLCKSELPESREHKPGNKEA